MRRLPYTARMGCGVIGTLLSQPLPRMSQRLAEYEAARPANGVEQPQQAYVMVSFLVAKTRQEAHALAKENWRAIRCCPRRWFAVVSGPELLILDEPFSGLDPVNAEVLKDAVLD